MGCREVSVSTSCKPGLMAVMWVVMNVPRLFPRVIILILVIMRRPPSHREGSVISEKQSCKLDVTRPDMFSLLNEWISVELGLKANVL